MENDINEFNYSSDDEYIPPKPVIKERLIDNNDYYNNYDEELNKVIKESMINTFEYEDIEFQKAIEENLLLNSINFKYNNFIITEQNLEQNFKENLQLMQDQEEEQKRLLLEEQRLLLEEEQKRLLLEEQRLLLEEEQRMLLEEQKRLLLEEEKKTRGNLLNNFIENIKRINKIDSSEILILLINILEQYIECEIDDYTLNNNELYNKIFEELKNIRIKPDIMKTLKNIIL